MGTFDFPVLPGGKPGESLEYYRAVKPLRDMPDGNATALEKLVPKECASDNLKACIDKVCSDLGREPDKSVYLAQAELNLKTLMFNHCGSISPALVRYTVVRYLADGLCKPPPPGAAPVRVKEPETSKAPARPTVHDEITEEIPAMPDGSSSCVRGATAARSGPLAALFGFVAAAIYAARNAPQPHVRSIGIFGAYLLYMFGGANPTQDNFPELIFPERDRLLGSGMEA